MRILFVCGFIATLLLLVGVAIPRTLTANQHQQTVEMKPFSARADTYVALGRFDDGDPESTSLGVGYQTSDNANDFLTLRTLVQFDVSSIPVGSKIISATLSLYAITAVGEPTMNVTIERVLNPWQEDISWNNHLSLTIDSTMIARTAVGGAQAWYTWDVQQHMQAWVNDRRPAGYIGLIVKGDESPSNHRRAFWSKDCTSSDCQARKPILSIRYELPTPTPTITPTATNTPTPTPGLAYVYLSNQPTRAIAPGSEVTYTINIGAADNPLTTFTLRDVQISNPVPTKLELISGSLIASPKMTPTFYRLPDGSTMVAGIQPALEDGETASLAYRARLPAPTAPPTTTPTPLLAISKRGPITATAGMAIDYILNVTNHDTHALSDLIITDRIPDNALYLPTDNGAILTGRVLRWEEPRLAAGATLTKEFSVAANQTITNETYSVSANQGELSTAGVEKVVTYIGEPPPSSTSDIITNSGATAIWFTDGQPGILFSGRVTNPTHRVLLPLVGDP